MSVAMGRRARWGAIGFLAGYGFAYALQLSDLTHPHFEALYETSRPHGLLAVLRFQHAFEAAFLFAGVVGACIGLLASQAVRRGSIAARAP